MMRFTNPFAVTHDRPRMGALLVIFAGVLVVGAVTGRGLGQCITNETAKLLASDGAAAMPSRRSAGVMLLSRQGERAVSSLVCRK